MPDFIASHRFIPRESRNKMGGIVWPGVLRYKLPEQMAVGVGARISKSHRFPSAVQHEGDMGGTVSWSSPSAGIARFQRQGEGTYKSHAIGK